MPVWPRAGLAGSTRAGLSQMPQHPGFLAHRFVHRWGGTCPSRTVRGTPRTPCTPASPAGPCGTLERIHRAARTQTDTTRDTAWFTRSTPPAYRPADTPPKPTKTTPPRAAQISHSCRRRARCAARAGAEHKSQQRRRERNMPARPEHATGAGPRHHGQRYRLRNPSDLLSRASHTHTATTAMDRCIAVRNEAPAITVPSRGGRRR